MLELVQFRHSPFNEKVRWALDLKGVPHVRRSVLPGPHLVSVKRLTGHTHTPVLIHEGRAIEHSAHILAWLEVHAPSLHPADPDARDEALRIQRWFDDDLTPRIRRVVLDTLLREPSYWARVFAEAQPSWQQRAYGLAMPLAASVVRKANGILGPESVEDGHRAIVEALDFAARAPAGDHLVGGSLTVADVTVASTLASLLGAARSPMTFPEPVGALFRALIARYEGHAGAAWMARMYARHRGAEKDFEGPSQPARLGPMPFGQARSGPRSVRARVPVPVPERAAHCRRRRNGGVVRAIFAAFRPSSFGHGHGHGHGHAAKTSACPALTERHWL
jgi:glutathione S-transferase